MHEAVGKVSHQRLHRASRLIVHCRCKHWSTNRKRLRDEAFSRDHMIVHSGINRRAVVDFRPGVLRDKASATMGDAIGREVVINGITPEALREVQYAV